MFLLICYLHPSIVNILFEHRRYIRNIFLQIKGLYEISHFGINIINPTNELIAFSSTPHIEYNLIQQKLWQHDCCFYSRTLNVNTLFWWDGNSHENPFSRQIKRINLSIIILVQGSRFEGKLESIAFCIHTPQDRIRKI